MSLQVQYNLFESPEESERKAMLAKIQEIHLSTEKVRKGTYAKIGDLRKIVLDLQERLNIIESAICKGKEGF